jgi:hypothetical protein
MGDKSDKKIGDKEMDIIRHKISTGILKKTYNVDESTVRSPHWSAEALQKTAKSRVRKFLDKSKKWK